MRAIKNASFKTLGRSSTSVNFLNESPVEIELQRRKYENDGFSSILRILDEDDITPVQELIYKQTERHLAPHDPGLPLVDRLKIPFVSNLPHAAWGQLMTDINSSAEFRDIAEGGKIKSSFERLRDENMVYYPISRFRASVPGIKRSQFSWHQDEGVQYAMTDKQLAYWDPTTLWLSLNGADESNSIELLPGSHLGKLEYHRFVDGQGNFDATPPGELFDKMPIRIRAEAGEGIFFHSLLFHRTASGECGLPRYSLDIRYCAEFGRRKKYQVRIVFMFKRLLNIFGG